ncbi:AAA family ATPase [Allobaculum fili]|uniref:AAA family ATPase n=2 Tax=Allobaculum TaxID=174708 RepID=UPI001E4F0590|nr:AAA family ATPase [Allobaculum fili]
MAIDKEALIKDMLAYIDPAALSYSEWVEVGMAIKAEDLPVNIWDSWSRADDRYKDGECELKWNTFNSSGTTGATITHLAKKGGWQSKKTPDNAAISFLSLEEGEEYALENYQITIDPTKPMVADPAEQARLQLQALFDPDDQVNIVTKAIYKEDRGKWVPGNKGFSYSLSQILDFLKGGLDSFIGDRNKQAGVWLRLNPMDGKGVKNENTTKFKHVLVESDSMPLDKQIEIYKRLELPITTLTLSGSKSAHALVKVDAQNAAEYAERVRVIFKACTDQGLVLDSQNKNPSRLTRLAGCERGDKQQSLLSVNIGKRSYQEWAENVQIDSLPEYESLADIFKDPPELPPETIRGVLRRGEKLVLTGPSKAGKSFALIQLLVALGTGSWWMGRFQCAKQRAVYINLELTKENSAVRVMDVWKALRRSSMDGVENVSIWNLRGSSVTTKSMVDSIIKRHKSMANPPDFYIVDPIYKIQAGDENAAKDVNEMLREFDRLCKETGANLVYAHHHAKGSQYGKRALDRGSGSGVIGRDVDAAIDLDFLFVPEAIRKKKAAQKGDQSWMKATGLRVEMTLRNFESKPPFNVWFNYPIHVWDSDEEFQALRGDSEKTPLNKAEDGKAAKKIDTDKAIKRTVDDLIEESGSAQMKDIEEETGLSRKRIRQFLNENTDQYLRNDGQVTRVGFSEKSESPS